MQVLLTAQLLNDSARAQWAAPLRKVRRKAKRKAGPVIEDLATDGDVGFVFAADLSSAEGFSYDEEGADAQPTPDSGVDAVASEIEASSTPEPLFVEAPVAEPADAETTTDMEAAEADDLSAEPTDDLPATASEEEGDG
ncbi:MAG TPA: hypothetical protein VOA87_18275 [Thermoanaerobaculia bacterium]|nr:hypothetical protein [Thermoanaerobaculia bacterium]